MFKTKVILSLILFFTQIKYNFGIFRPEDYLMKYGYLSTTQRTEGDLKESLTTFQTIFRLPVTGVFDVQTRDMMSRPRCGNKDPVERVMNRIKNRIKEKGYTLEGSKWTNYKMTYKIVEYSDKYDKSQILKEIQKAWKAWAAVTPLRLIHVTEKRQKVHFDMAFATGMHCCHPGSTPDQSKFVEDDATLAHAAYPRYGGDIHINDYKTFVFNESGADRHALGLEHHMDPGSIMFPLDFGKTNALDNGTIDGIRVLYGNESIVLP